MTRYQRQKKRKADAILSADWHLTEKTPVARTDDYREAQSIKVKFIFDLSIEHDCPVLIAGDVGDKSSWPNSLLVWFLRKSGTGAFKRLVIIPGQHDLPSHNLENIDKSGMGVLAIVNEKIDVITIPGTGVRIADDIFVYGYPFGTETVEKNGDAKYKVAMIHKLVIEDKSEHEWQDEVVTSAKTLLKNYPEYQLILSGDNHKPFVVNFRGRLLVNPGSLMRSRADQVNHKPRVYLWYKDTNEVEPVYLPIDQDVLDRTHIDETNQRNDRVTAYVKHLKENTDVTFSFEDNMEKEFRNNRIRKGVKDKIREAMNDDMV